MKDEIKEISIKIPGQILDYVDTKEHLLKLFNYIINLQDKNERCNNIIDELDNKINKLELSELKYLDKIYTQDLKIIKLNNKVSSIKDYLYSYYDVESENFILNDEDIYSELMEKLKED